MHPQTIYTKTAKGVLEVKNKTLRLSRELALAFLAVDGKSPARDIAAKAGIADNEAAAVFDKLVADGYIKVFTETAAPAAVSEDLDLDLDRKSTRLNSSHVSESRMPSSA